MTLLVNRFDGRKEKADDVNQSIKDVKDLLKEEKITEKQATFLLSSVIECKNIHVAKAKQK